MLRRPFLRGSARWRWQRSRRRAPLRRTFLPGRYGWSCPIRPALRPDPQRCRALRAPGQDRRHQAGV